VRRAVAFVEAERARCPFFTCEPRFEPGHGPPWLAIRGGAEIEAMVADAFATVVAATAAH